jgi:dolichol-phosphate mannosyltransferase
MTSPRPKLSVVCPAYEEEEVLPLFHAELRAALDRIDDNYEIEIIYIDDGSRDRTLEVMRGLANGDPRVRYLSLSRNFGQQAALTAGLEHARGDVIVSLDSDMQHPPALIPKLLAQWRAGYDVVLTLRMDDPRLGWFKRFSSHAFYKVMACLSDTEVRAAASDYRLMSRKALNSLLSLRETHRFLRGLVNWVGYSTATVPFMPAVRGGGVTKYSFRRMLALASDGLLSFSKLPLRAPFWLAGAAIALGCSFGATVLTASLFGHSIADGMLSAVLVTMLVLGGCILGALGVVGEYLGRVYEQVKSRPHYLLKEASPDLVAGKSSNRALPLPPPSGAAA